jgi:hypothetical protein
MSLDYGNTIIYKISCNEVAITDVYVGHTTDFVKRKYAHCKSSADPNCTNKLYTTIREHGGWSNWTMKIIGYFDCKNLTEAREKEQELFIQLGATLNSVEPLPRRDNKVEKVENTKMKTVEVKRSVSKIYIAEQTPDTFREVCELCHISCYRKNDWDRHLLTAKHIKNSTLDVFAESTKTEYKCDKCDYVCNKQSLWEKHIYTKKHSTVDVKKNPVQYECKKCKKVYDRYNSYWAHNKKCDAIPPETSIYAIVNKLISDNQELRQFILDQSSEHKKETHELINKTLECCKPVTINTLA